MLWCSGIHRTSDLVVRNASAKMSIVSLGAVRSLDLGDERLRPFASMGLGVKRYTFDWNSVRDLLPAGEVTLTDLALQFGAGAEWAWRGVSVVAELEDYATWFGPDRNHGLQRPGDSDEPIQPESDSRLIHDLSVSLGANIRLF